MSSSPSTRGNNNQHDPRIHHGYRLDRRVSLNRKTSSTIPIPDLSMLTMGVPEMVIASKANDPCSPPTRRLRKASNLHATPQGQDPALVADLGAMFISDGGTPIELPERTHHEDPVPGIDGAAVVRRPGIGVTRPSDEEKRVFVQGWTVNGRVQEGSNLSPTEGKRKSVNFEETAYHPRRHREESYTSTTSSGSGSETLIYSPPEESPPLDGSFYTGTILELLVSDPEALREYRHLERKKDMERRGSAASGGSTGSGSRSGSLSAGSHEEWILRTSLEHGKKKPHHHTSPQARRTTLVDAWADGHAERRPSLTDGNVPSPTRIHTSPLTSNASLHASPSSVHAPRQPLFHPDLHPVADHSGSRYDVPDMLGSSCSLPKDAMYDPARVSLGIDQEAGREVSPASSSGTIRPPLAGEDGKPKAHTVADCRAEDGWSA